PHDLGVPSHMGAVALLFLSRPRITTGVGSVWQMKFSAGNSIGQLADFVRAFTSSVPRPLQLGGLLLVLGASLTEGLSISLLGPLLGLMGDPSGSSGPTRDAARGLLHVTGLHLSLPTILAIFVPVVLCRSAFVRKRDIVLFDLWQRFTTTLRRRLC